MGIEFKSYASGSSGNFHTLDDGITKLMVECGISWKNIQKTLNFKTSDYDACLLTHQHMDHAAAAKDIVRAGIDLYALPETLGALGIESHRAKPIQPKKQFTVGSWTILPFDLRHDVPSVGYLLSSKNGGKFVFITDSFYSPYSFKGLTGIALEINFDMQTLNENVAAGIVPLEMKNRLLRSHFSLENAVEFLKANDLSKVKGIWIIHSSDGNSNINRIKTTIQKVTGKPVYVC